MLRTRITELLGIEHPVMSAPMALHSGGRLAAAVSEAGGLGSFGAVNLAGPDWVREQIRYVRSQTNKPFCAGFITNFIPMFRPHFEVLLEERVPVMAFSFGDATPWLAKAKEAGAITMCQVQTVGAAQQALDAGADIIVAQGNEAGGHTGSMNLLPLLTRIVELHPDVPVMAAGGIASGRALAAVLAAGADGAWAGTAFLATPEAVEVPEAYKQRILQSDGEDTIFTEVFDIVEGLPWPEGIGGRAHRNRFAQEWHGREEELRQRREEIAPSFVEARDRHDADTVAVYMGQAAGFVDRIRPAAEVLGELCAGAERVLRERAREVLR